VDTAPPARAPGVTGAGALAFTRPQRKGEGDEDHSTYKQLGRVVGGERRDAAIARCSHADEQRPDGEQEDHHRQRVCRNSFASVTRPSASRPQAKGFRGCRGRPVALTARGDDDQASPSCYWFFFLMSRAVRDQPEPAPGPEGFSLEGRRT